MSKKKTKCFTIEWLNPFQVDKREQDNTAIVEYVRKTVENTVVSRLDGIVSKESVMINDSKEPVSTTMFLADEAHTLNILNQHKADSGEEYTVVYICNRKHIDDVFKIVDGIQGTLRFNDIFLNSDIARKHQTLNVDANGNISTSVIYIPGLIVNRGKIPFHYNLLILVEPTYKELAAMYQDCSDDIDNFDIHNAIIMRIISDTLDACIKLGCKDIILNPYGYKPLQKADYDWTGALWKKAVGSKKVKNNFYSITFCASSDNQYVGFMASRVNSDVYDAMNRVSEIEASLEEPDDEQAEHVYEVKKRRRAKVEID